MIFKIIVEVQNGQIYSVYAECNKFALIFGIYFYVTVQTKTRKVYIFLENITELIIMFMESLSYFILTSDWWRIVED